VLRLSGGGQSQPEYDEICQVASHMAAKLLFFRNSKHHYLQKNVSFFPKEKDRSFPISFKTAVAGYFMLSLRPIFFQIND